MGFRKYFRTRVGPTAFCLMQQRHVPGPAFQPTFQESRFFLFYLVNVVNWCLKELDATIFKMYFIIVNTQNRSSVWYKSFGAFSFLDIIKRYIL